MPSQNLTDDKTEIVAYNPQRDSHRGAHVDNAGETSVDRNTADKFSQLIRVDSDGNMTYRENGDWLPVDNAEDFPNIFDRDLIDIEPSDVSAAVALWDKNTRSEAGVKKEDLLPFAALVQ